MFHSKLIVAVVFITAAIVACSSSNNQPYVIADSKAYEASIFRANCAICHGPEANGKTLTDGRVVPSLRVGPFKFKSEEEIYHQISDGGNGMPPFREQLTEREMRMMAKFVHDQLRR
jgi:mono/diheme cytochrome c family protein